MLYVIPGVQQVASVVFSRGFDVQSKQSILGQVLAGQGLIKLHILFANFAPFDSLTIILFPRGISVSFNTSLTIFANLLPGVGGIFKKQLYPNFLCNLHTPRETKICHQSRRESYYYEWEVQLY